MKKLCAVCMKEFDTKGRAKTCGVECWSKALKTRNVEWRRDPKNKISQKERYRSQKYKTSVRERRKTQEYKEREKARRKTPKYKAYLNSSKYKAYMKAYGQRPGRKAYEKARCQTAERKCRQRGNSTLYARNYWRKKQSEKRKADIAAMLAEAKRRKLLGEQE